MLQDVHWSGGGIGYFPTYALGNVISLQIWATVREALPDLDDQLAAGDVERALANGCATTSTRSGRKLTPRETLERADGLGRDRPAAVPRVPAREDGGSRGDGGGPVAIALQSTTWTRSTVRRG